jgi:hypothetical protein
MDKAVLEPRCPQHAIKLAGPTGRIGDSHHVLDDHRANVTLNAGELQRAKRDKVPQDRMSALPPKADIGTQPRDVRFVPKADSCTAAINAEFRTGIAGFSPVVDVG